MRHSEFVRLVEDEFGSGYASSLTHDLTLSALGGKTADEALAEGVSPRTVWLALCDAMDVPVERRLGRDHHDRRRA